jgi:hypothetical protein
MIWCTTAFSRARIPSLASKHYILIPRYPLGLVVVPTKSQRLYYDIYSITIGRTISKRIVCSETGFDARILNKLRATLENGTRDEYELTIWRALSISSQSSKFDAMPELEAMEFLSTRKESYTPSCTGSMGSPVVKFSPTLLPSACSS